MDGLGLAYPDDAPQKLARYHALLADWNERLNLTGDADFALSLDRHYTDSLAPLMLGGLFPVGASLIDVGSGAGFPGLPLAIARPDLRVTLLDSLNKRVVFLQAVCDRLGLSDVACVHARAEEGARDAALRERFDVAAARAVAHTAFLAEWLVPYLKVGGKALLYKGPQAENELNEAQNACATLHCSVATEGYNAPWGERRVVVLTKNAPTDKRFPRKAGTKEHL